MCSSLSHLNCCCFSGPYSSQSQELQLKLMLMLVAANVAPAKQMLGRGVLESPCQYVHLLIYPDYLVWTTPL